MKSFLTVSLIAATMLSSAAYAASPAKAQAATPAATQTSSSWASDNGFSSSRMLVPITIM